ncbi:hypothetical protein HYH02_000087 [Chlamydomonas schloesseri]|uniref:Uncharacterized protein n=1 Tax=Chlamydomonas schloesseri TaxID=2026947 RepID=A0A835WLK3_9CHLO|nr:hypothetical protein HYH02_000087 [Chlamydomonas schloesseri]|eukprot:KAG2449983.1 hypothetical protein HYH02_000087 [Chlamydomonas schloesseri]
MPLYFEEVAPDPKAKKDKDASKQQRPAILVERKGPPPAPMHLESQVVPTLIRKVGDWKTGRISQAMCEAYLDRHTLVFDRELLTKLFTEADYQKEGSVDTRALTIAIAGRFPKREHTADWRLLTALLLGLPELVLTTDAEVTQLRTTHERPAGGGTYNSGNIWDSPPPPLPPVRRRTGSGRSTVGKVTAHERSPEWLDTLNRTTAAASLSAGGSPLASTAGSFSTGTASLNASMLRTGSVGAMDAGGAGVVGTTGGLKQMTQIADEARLNAALVGGGASTFATQREFADWSRGLEVMPRLASDSAGPGPGPGSEFGAGGSTVRTATHLGSPKAQVRVWAAPLPPSAISLPSSALRTLRETVRNTANTKPDFVKGVKPLDSHELDMKKTLGEPLDVAMSLARVEPVRSTKVLPNSDYVTWGDHANCRTGPTGWDSKHPTARAQDTGEHKYPWC